MLEPNDFIITRKRKKYRFAKFSNFATCFEADQWQLPRTKKLIHLELGAGTALFSVELATRYPDQFFVAVDVKADRLQKGAGVAQERGLTNIHFVRIHTNKIIDVVPARSVDNIWVTFPDPHPKKRSSKHRLTHPNFLRLYRNILSKNGQLLFKTDNHSLFCWSLEQLAAEKWQLTQLSFDLHGTDLSDDYKIMTTYEQRFVSEGLPTHFATARPN